MLRHRIFKNSGTVWPLLPVHHIFATSYPIRRLTAALSGSGRKLAAIVSCVVITGWFAWGRHFLPALFFVIPVFGILSRFAIERISTSRKVRQLASNFRKYDELPLARETLHQMGLDEVVLKRILTDASANPEVLIGEFDQNNRFASEVGRIPLFDGFQIDPENFKQRSNSRVTLVVMSNVVAIKKSHRRQGSFCSEVLILNALSDIDGVPKLIGIRLGSRTIYESFILGKNVGSLMSERGAPISVQYQADVKYRAGRKWSGFKAPPSERALAVKAFRTVVSEDFVTELGLLFERIHNAGVIVRDVKYGNVMIQDGKPFLVDFDVGRIVPKDTMVSQIARAADRDRFNYFFGDAQNSEH